MPNGTGTIKISHSDLTDFRKQANTYIEKVKWKEKIPAKKSDPSSSTYEWRESSSMLSNSITELSLILSARRISQSNVLFTDTVNLILNEIVRGLSIGMHLSKLYVTSSGLGTLMDANKRNVMTQDQQTEFSAKLETSSAIALFGTAYYILWALNSYRSDEVGNVNVEFSGVPEVHLLNPLHALECGMFYYVWYLEKTGQIASELDMLKMTLRYFEALLEEIRFRKDSLKFTQFFTDKTYQLEKTQFSISGFEASYSRRIESIEFNEVKFEQIVGNKDAKHKGKRWVERICCYDLNRKLNPLLEFGGIANFAMGFGPPGTGKSMLISAIATYFKMLAEIAGHNFLFWPFPDNMVSTFQGGSAERATEWFKPFHDPTKIIFAPIDDAENILEERTRQNVSGGVREVIGVMLRQTEGAYSVNRGSHLMLLFTNIQEQIDKAILSRIQDRMIIDGALTARDFIDQDYLWWRKYNEILPGFVNLEDPKDYVYLSDQKEVRSLSNIYSSIHEPTDEIARLVFQRVAEKFDPLKNHEFYGKFCQEIKHEYPFFTSRDLRNIEQAVNTRIMDFDFEPDWLEKPDAFYRKDYDQKKAMLLELIKANMKGVSFGEMRMQEMIRYIDASIRIYKTEMNRWVEQRLKDMEVALEAQKQFKQKHGELR